jgi:hypothetical protein
MRNLGRQDIQSLFDHLIAAGWGDYEKGRRITDPQVLVVNREVHVRFAQRAKEEHERRMRMRKIIMSRE